MPKPDIEHSRLLEVLRYDPEDGNFYWLKRISIRVKVGNIAGSATPNGYVEIGVDGVSYQAHRLAWFYMTGEWPPEQIDHKDTVRNNNRWTNLRLATNGQNAQNSTISRNNSSGYKGVSYVKKLGKWHSRIMSNGELHLLGYFDAPAQAHEAYARKAAELNGEFARAA